MNIINSGLIKQLIQQATNSARKRISYNLHQQPDDTLQRMISVLEPGTYVQPHKHENPDKRELFIILSGKVLVVEYTESGEVAEFTVLSKENGNWLAELQPRVYHNIFALVKDTVVVEIKDGPYDPETDKKFASWAPAENSEGINNFVQRVMQKTGIQLHG